MPTMILHEKNLVYLHFPKTGGWFVSDILGSKGFQFSCMGLYGGHAGAGEFDDCITKFGFIRHPVSWHRSLFNYFCNCNFNNGKDFSYLRSDSLDDFVIKCIDGFSMMDLYNRMFAISTSKEADFIFRYEEMHTELPRFLVKHGVDCFDLVDSKKSSVVNGSSPVLDDSCSKETVEVICEYCEPIFTRFHYKMEDPSGG